MIIGLLSDTHGNLSRTRSALDALSAAGAEHLIHCGDLGGEEVLTLLFEKQQEGVPVTAVAGNVDEWNPDLILYAKKLGLPLPRTTRVELDGIAAAICHGHRPEDMATLLDDPDIGLVFTGHTHIPRDETVGNTRFLNPGALHRAEVPGYALFNTVSQGWTRKAL